MEEYNKLEKLINKYLFECSDKKIKIITTKPDNELIKLIQKNYKEVEILNGNKINSPCLVIILQDIDNKILDLINQHMKQNVMFLAVVPLEFNFDNLVKSVEANSIDADYWRVNGKKYKSYVITVKWD